MPHSQNFYSLSPGKQLSKEHIPFKQLRQVINDFVGENRQQLAAVADAVSPTPTNDSTVLCNDFFYLIFSFELCVETNFSASKMLGMEEKMCGGNLDLSDDSSSRISFDDSLMSRSKNYFLYKNSDHFSPKTSLYKLPRQSRKLMQMRTRRRESLQTKNFIALGIVKRGSPLVFYLFLRLLESCNSSFFFCLSCPE